MTIFAPEDSPFPVGQGDDTLAMQWTLNQIRSNHGGRARWLGMRYDFDALDLTGCAMDGVYEIEIGAYTKLVWNGASGVAAPMLDLTNSHKVYFIGAAGRWESGTAAVKPQTSILICGGDRFHIPNLTVGGDFTSCGLAIIASSSVVIGGQSQILNINNTAPALTISNVPDWWLTSKFSTIPPSQNVGDILLQNTELHAFSDAMWTVYHRNTDHVQYDCCLFDNSKRSHFLFQGNSKKTTLVAPKFYSERGIPGSYLFECDQAGFVSDTLRVINGQNDNGLTQLVGSGQFTNYSWN